MDIKYKPLQDYNNENVSNELRKTPLEQLVEYRLATAP